MVPEEEQLQKKIEELAEQARHLKVQVDLLADKANTHAAATGAFSKAVQEQITATDAVVKGAKIAKAQTTILGNRIAGLTGNLKAVQGVAKAILEAVKAKGDKVLRGVLWDNFQDLKTTTQSEDNKAKTAADPSSPKNDKDGPGSSGMKNK